MIGDVGMGWIVSQSVDKLRVLLRGPGRKIEKSRIRSSHTLIVNTEVVHYIA